MNQLFCFLSILISFIIIVLVPSNALPADPVTDATKAAGNVTNDAKQGVNDTLKMAAAATENIPGPAAIIPQVLKTAADVIITTPIQVAEVVVDNFSKILSPASPASDKTAAAATKPNGIATTVADASKGFTSLLGLGLGFFG
ncbi:uncharacterized protein LOC112056446 [Bicyclus anynana]|uniref:Uncharacterized protein LOC112056446 n=1 Tax=Bicyclus anynana TaxID=110368 RepID=A0ABM3LGF4_BICAN|nr:uncharacterized protein LOC112056446 [Bicyclus anynana]